MEAYKAKLQIFKAHALFALRVEGDEHEAMLKNILIDPEARLPYRLYARDGRLVCITHSDDLGHLSGNVSDLQRADILISCYPLRTRINYPHLRRKYPEELCFWDTVLKITIYCGWLFVFHDDFDYVAAFRAFRKTKRGKPRKEK